MKRVLSVELLAILLILILISIFTYIDTRQFMLEGFTSNTTTGGSNLMLFHADWCGYCKKMKPDWDRASKEFPGRCIEVESENITEEHRNKFSINGYPSIFIVRGETIEEWNRGRTFEDFKSFLEEN